MDIKVMFLYLGTIIFLFAIFMLFRAIIVILRQKKKKQQVIGFFHPYTNDGGGGERVLWCMVKALQEEMPSMPCAIYTGDDASPTSLSKRALDRFGVQLHSMPKVVRLRKRVWVEATSYPYFTILGQGLGSMVLAWEALCALTPVLFIDTSGYAFTYPLASCFGCRVVCYTHYPTISTDMLSRVLAQKSMYNNKSFISQSKVLSSGKALYYMLISRAYKLVGGFTHLAIVNSSWTQLHIEELWRLSGGVVRIYPPCDTLSLQALPLERKAGHPYIISVAQFRPEKAHDMQLEAFAQALERIQMVACPSGWVTEPKLKLVGSCRHREDEERVRKLKEKCSVLGIEKHVDFHLNVPYEELKDLLAGAVAGLHSMIDEHFGIVVVEYMAAGAVPIAHNSAGPKMDIVLDEDGQRTGFLAVSVEEFSEAIFSVLTMPEEERLCIAGAARKRANCFSEERFDRNFKVAMQPVLASLKQKLT